MLLPAHLHWFMVPACGRAGCSDDRNWEVVWCGIWVGGCIGAGDGAGVSGVGIAEGIVGDCSVGEGVGGIGSWVYRKCGGSRVVVHVEDRWLLVGNRNSTRASSVFLEVSLNLLIRGHIFITSNLGGGRWDSFNLRFGFLFFPLHKLMLILVLEVPASDPVLGIEVGHGGR